MLLAIATFAESPISAFPVTHNNVIVTGISATITEENVTTAADANTFPTGEILTDA
jgi:hypothetical protein